MEDLSNWHKCEIKAGTVNTSEYGLTSEFAEWAQSCEGAYKFGKEQVVVDLSPDIKGAYGMSYQRHFIYFQNQSDFAAYTLTFLEPEDKLDPEVCKWYAPYIPMTYVTVDVIIEK